MRKGFVWALLILALLLSVWTITISSSFHSCVNNQQAASAEQSPQNPPKLFFSVANHIAVYWRCGLHVGYDYRDAVTAIATAFIALFTLTLWQSTSGLVDAAAKQSADTQAAIAASNRSAKAAEDATNAAFASNQISAYNAEQRLRAYVTALDVHMVTHRRHGTLAASGQEIQGAILIYEFAVILKNGGQTPAVNVRTNINLQNFQTGVPPDFNFPDSDTFGHGLIGPQIEWHTPRRGVSASLIEDISLTWAIWGWIEYDDIFTRSGSTSRHRTEFCFRIERRRLPVTNELWIGFIPHDRFNAADLDCLRPIDPVTNQSSG